MAAHVWTLCFLAVLAYLLHQALHLAKADATTTLTAKPSGHHNAVLSGSCVQKTTCEHFKDILVIIHLNPQRLDWMQHVVKYARTFVPHVMLTSLPRVETLKNLTVEEKREYLDFLYLGEDRTPVHLIENGYGLWGDHNDLVMAMKLYPGYTGYLYWAHDDTLLAFWNLVRLDKYKAWYQPVQSLFSFTHSDPMCGGRYRKKHKVGSKIRVSGRRCIVPMIAEEARDWIKLDSAREQIKNISKEDHGRIVSGVTFGIPVYYAPATVFEKLDRYSEILFRAQGVNEWSVHILLAAASPNGSESLNAVNIWPGQQRGKGRFHPYDEFSWLHDLTHPVKANGELFSRVLHLASQHDLTPGYLSNVTRDSFWGEPFTCDEYPSTGPYSHDRKGRFHTCSPGCPTGTPVAPTSRNGAVCINNNDSIPPTELPFEGFWSEQSHNAIFSLYPVVNGTGRWATPEDLKK